MASAERRQLVTIEMCIWKDGRYLPPMFVFSESSRRHHDTLMFDVPPGSLLEYSNKGRMVTDLFFECSKAFADFSGASVDHPGLLILDGATVHTQNRQLCDHARNHGVRMVSLPPHTTQVCNPWM